MYSCVLCDIHKTSSAACLHLVFGAFVLPVILDYGVDLFCESAHSEIHFNNKAIRDGKYLAPLKPWSHLTVMNVVDRSGG